MPGQHDSTDGDDSKAPFLSVIDGEKLRASIDPEIVKTVAKLTLGMGALVFLLGLVSLLPGLDRLVPATPITVAALVIAVITLGIVGVLVSVAPHLETLVQQGFAGPEALAASVAAIVKHLVVFLAILVAYEGLAGAVVPFLAGSSAVWVYDLSFLLLAIVPTALVASHLYRGLDPAATLVTRKVTATDDPVPATETGAVSAGSDQGTPGGTPDPSRTGDPGATAPLSPRGLRRTRLVRTVEDYLSLGESSESEVLTKEEQILNLLEERGGRVKQSEIVEATNWSKATVSRLLSKMEGEGLVAKIDLGQGNLIALPDGEPEGSRAVGPDRRN